MIVYKNLCGMQIEIHERTSDERVHDDLDGQPRNHDGSNTG